MENKHQGTFAPYHLYPLEKLRTVSQPNPKKAKPIGPTCSQIRQNLLVVQLR